LEVILLEDLSGLFSLFATILGTTMSLAYFAQVYKIYRRKSVADISPVMYAVFLPGTLVWLLYGISINSTAVTAANVVGVAGVGGVLGEYFVYRK